MAVLFVAAAALPHGAVAAGASDPSQPGAYCPFPKAGEKPQCFTEVEQEYSDFFAAVDSGAVDAARVTEVEQTLASATDAEQRTLALSSIAYGYFMLAERAAAEEQPDPALVARLDSWNALLSSVYSDAEAEPSVRGAVREAALDLHARAPAVPSRDADCATGDADCETTSQSQLLAALRQIDDPYAETGVRGALRRLLGRFLDEDDATGAAEAD